jgi:hypothetical protein
MFRSSRMCKVPSPRVRLENDSGEIATRMNMTNRTGIAAIVMQIVTKRRAPRNRTLRQEMDS